MDEMLAACRAGFWGNPNPHIYSSPVWYAHAIGAHLHRDGYRTLPQSCRMGRGYRVRVDGAVWKEVTQPDGRPAFVKES